MSCISVNINCCRICENKNIDKVISLGEQYITSRFPIYGEWDFPKTPIDLCLCNDCGLIQLLQTTNSNEMYEYDYGYRSGISNTMRLHLQEYNCEILSIVNDLKNDDYILDIGSNDSTMLNNYPENLNNLVGIDPTGNQFIKYYTRATLIDDYFTKDIFQKKYGNTKCKIISSISMFYDLPDPVQFAKDIYDILDDDGIWTCEQSYILTMIQKNSIDTICHEHLEYYALKQIKKIADLCGFKIHNIVLNDCNGGSFRIYFAKQNSTKYIECKELISSMLEEEEKYELNKKETYEKFISNCDYEIKKLKNLLTTINENGQNTYIYGASTKGNCLLQYANINETDIEYAVERNLDKVGKMTNTGIKIISEERMRKNPPNFLLVLPYHFKDEIILRENEFLKNGGQLIFPLPILKIVGYNDNNDKKMLITGCEGHIGKYVKELFQEKYNLYGIGNTNNINNENKILKYYFDMTNYKTLDFVLDILQPNIIIHLAGISNSNEAYNNPIKTLETNGMLTLHLCDMIHKKKLNTILFNASSSEMFKGHEKYFIKDNDDKNKHHIHPYSIGKIMGHSIIDFYRIYKDLPFYNGVFFTIESKYKKKTFLLNKVANHAKNWNITKEILEVGNLFSYRNILHTSDAVKAIETIINSNEPDNYLICNDTNYIIFDLVYKIYSLCNIELYENNDEKDDEKDEEVYYYDKLTNLPVIKMTNKLLGHDTTITNINGTPTKLKNLGWEISFNINDILNELINTY
jgi:GDP-D-mannose dehydratase